MKLRNFEEDFDDEYIPRQKQKIKVKKMKDGKSSRIKTKKYNRYSNEDQY